MIITGDITTLERLLKKDPELIRRRSNREHRSTLLHYISANGIEDYRQKTPKNAVAVAKVLIAAGADVNAESAAYGGRATTLGLLATSVHTLRAGLQIPLMELNNGILVEFFRTWPGTLVNMHVARFAVAGANAERITSTGHWTSGFGIGSPLDRLLGLNGKIILLGCDHDSTTFLHYVEHVTDFRVDVRRSREWPDRNAIVWQDRRAAIAEQAGGATWPPHSEISRVWRVVSCSPS